MHTAEFWCALLLKCRATPPGEIIGTLYVRTPLVGLPHDRLVFCLTAPSCCQLQLAYRDQGGSWHALGGPETGCDTRMEMSRPMPANGVHEIRLQVTSLRTEAGAVQVSWFAVQHSGAVALNQSLRVQWDPAWSGLIRSESEWGGRKFRIGLLFDAKDLPALRAKADAPGWSGLFGHLEARAHALLARNPEEDIGEHPPWALRFFLRTRELGKQPLCYDALTLGLVGLIREDRRLIRHALRFLMAIAHLRHWYTSDECRVPGTTWDTRSFLEETHATTTALLMDWFDAELTDRARELLSTAIWDKGLGTIERDLAKHDYIMKCNQGPWFCRSRILGGLVLETLWPRMGNYVDRAHGDLYWGLEQCVRPDGGSDEGPGYLSATLEATLVGAYAYARARRRELSETVPPAVAHSPDYFCAISQTFRPNAFIPAEDCGRNDNLGDTIAILSRFFPAPVFDHIAGAYVPDARTIDDPWFYMGKGIWAFLLGPDQLQPAKAAPVPPLAIFPDTGFMTSRRTQGTQALRIHFAGSRANPTGHAHADRGAVLVDVNEQPLFIDRGIVRYEDPRVHLLQRSNMHNVLTLGTGQQRRASVPLIPTAKLAGRALHAHLDLTDVWKDEVVRYVRRIDSPSVMAWTITDEVLLNSEGPVTFHLHSPFPFQKIDGSIEVGEGAARVRICAAWAATVHSSEDLVDSNYRPIFHLQLMSVIARQHQITTDFVVIS